MEQFEPQPFIHLVEMRPVAPYSVGTSLPSLQCLPSLQPQKCNNYSPPQKSNNYSAAHLSRLPSLPPQKSDNNSAPPPSYHRHVKCAAPVRLQPQVAQQSIAVVPDEIESPWKRRDVIGLALDAALASALLTALGAAGAEIPCEFKVAPSGLAFCDQLVGTGPQAVKGQLIKAHYVGKLENGKVFDSSYNRGKPLTFRVGVGEVIKGWDEGILGGDGVPPMLAGGKRTLKLPPELGYGSRGAGCRGGSCIIPPGSILLFDVEFVSKA
ncbi:Peptidyl-prolyl cis-trans isomerase FKBP13 [Spatholobus suberectus]|nr:Peptidyl-prolyl cis-trans isomerase FKBP13 [Spatholobus suberectus]